MANRLGRYNAIYKTFKRPDNASTIPRHVFVRAANSQGSMNDRKGDRQDSTGRGFIFVRLRLIDSDP